MNLKVSNKFFVASFCLLFIAMLFIQEERTMAMNTAEPVRVVPSVDIARYVGRWFEIARLPNFFQKSCSGDVTATYTVRPDGKINVLNQCRTEKGSMKSANGTARIASKTEPNTKLKVTCFWTISGNNRIIELDPNYEWAVIGEPNRDYLWILSRQPQMDPALYESILERIRKQGYDTQRLLRTKQTLH